ncbi:inositol monophosphatase family protein [Pediococcus argentinicus]|uniref:inositol monophosphatase family protein n=1 Tax=Pediococcus argentinicus TaxID=480391 RepID=UPI00338E5A99
MTEIDFKAVDKQVYQILKDDRSYLLEQMKTKPLSISEKTGPRDLVTQIDKLNQKRLIHALSAIIPNSSFLGEETAKVSPLEDLKGPLWIVDPIDGTLNFVKQRDNFAVMIALYIDGIGKLGFIMDVMSDVIIHGGPDVNVWRDNDILEDPVDLDLSDGLMGLSGPMLSRNLNYAPLVEQYSLGARVIGSAGIEFMRIMEGRQVGYYSKLQPWDFAAGNILAPELGLVVTNLDGSKLDMLKSSVVLVATKKAHKDILNLID